jgi:hypothetical protein
MAIINKTGITNGDTIQAEHVTRAIDALSGGSTDSVVATGSFTGSFTGTLTGLASQATAINMNAATEDASYYIASVKNATGIQVAFTDTNLRFNPNTNALTLTGSLTASGSLNMTATPASVVNLGAISSSGNFAIPSIEPTSPLTGSLYVDFNAAILYIYDGATWRQIPF